MSEQPMRETPEAAKAFEDYYDLGEDRSLVRLAQKRLEDLRIKYRETTKKLPSETTLLANLKKWSAAHNWQERVKAYDVVQAAKERAKRQKAIDAMNERHAQIGVTQQARALEQIKALVEAKKFGSQASVQLLKLATDIERLARGAATERAEITGKDGEAIKIERADYSRLSNEELAILEQLAEKAHDGGN